MGLAIELETSFLADVDGTPVMGRCSVLSAAERLAYVAAHATVNESGDQQELVKLIDQWVERVLVECDATIGGQVYSKQPEDMRPRYVAHLPMEAKQAVTTAALGLKELAGGAEGNSESGPPSG